MEMVNLEDADGGYWESYGYEICLEKQYQERI